MSRYKERMKIEHEFRSIKSTRLGMGLELGRSHDTKRLELLLLIGALAMLMLWLIGVAAENKKLHYSFQANSIKTHRVLSFIFLGMQVVKHALERITKEDLSSALQEIQLYNSSKKDDV